MSFPREKLVVRLSGTHLTRWRVATKGQTLSYWNREGIYLLERAMIATRTTFRARAPGLGQYGGGIPRQRDKALLSLTADDLKDLGIKFRRVGGGWLHYWLIPRSPFLADSSPNPCSRYAEQLPRSVSARLREHANKRVRVVARSPARVGGV